LHSVSDAKRGCRAWTLGLVKVPPAPHHTPRS
jgi:hypothetical protein